MEPWERQLQLMQSIPASGRSSAREILAEVGPEPPVFPDAACLADWAGLHPGNNESADKCHPGRKRATVATAPKLPHMTYAILRDDHPYRALNKVS